jgi:DNA mismatch repair ATPase MutS
LTPLLDPMKINERLDAVEDLMRLKWHTEEFRKRLATCIDLEKILARVFVYSVKNDQKTVKFEFIGFKRLKEFKMLLGNFK